MATPSARCRACTRPYVEISLAQGGSTMVLRSCSSCDIREWHVDGGLVDLDRVLGTVAEERKPRTLR